jgi:hypothetical protein
MDVGRQATGRLAPRWVGVRAGWQRGGCAFRVAG